MDEEPTESLWVRIKGRAGIGDIIVGVCYRPLNQEDQADEVLYRHIEAASHSQALLLMGNFNQPISVGGTVQQGISNPGSCLTMLMITSFSK